MVLNVFEQFYSAEMTANGRPRHAALVMLISDSEEGRIRYEAAVTFFPYDDPEDFAVSYDAYFSKVLYDEPGKRSKKRETELLLDFRRIIDEMAERPENSPNFADNGTLWTPGKVFWDKPLRPARGDHELPPLSEENKAAGGDNEPVEADAAAESGRLSDNKEKIGMGRKNFGAKPLSIPQPVWIIATYDENGVPDAMNAAWGGISEENEVSVCLSVGHKTCKNFEKTGAFTISMADAEHIAGCDYVGISSGNQTPDKFARAGFTATKSAFVNAPVINELAVCLECRVKEFSHETCILKGEIVNVSVSDLALTEGKVDLAKVKPVCFDPFNNAYHVIGEKVGDAFGAGKALL